MATRLVSRISTLDAARAVYFIVIGLAIQRSLGLLTHVWPPNQTPNSPNWPLWARAIIAAGYLVTVIRFSHGVTLLYGHEKQRIESSTLPSASSISLLSLFLVLLAIPFFLMADSITETDWYISWTAIMLGVDFVYILISGVVRQPLRRIFKILKETESGFAAHAAFWWLATDVFLFIACGLFLVVGPTQISNWPAREIAFASVLIIGALADYSLNGDFYFGGRKDRRKQKFVFVISPLRDPDPKAYKENVNRAQFYCFNLMNSRSRFAKQITPLASHAFFPYFLNDELGEDRALGMECALAFLSACDAVHVYVPVRDTMLKAFFDNDTIKWLVQSSQKLSDSLSKGWLNRLIQTVDKNEESLSKGMKYALQEAKILGIEIKYLRAITDPPQSEQWSPPDWVRITFKQDPVERKPSESYFRAAAQRKRVYVCTRFRGMGFDEKPLSDKVKQLEDSSRLALWHCYSLAKDPDEAVAPFAPHAFYPYFWKFTNNNTIDLAKWKSWFNRSIEILKVCDAVYVYTPEGLPETQGDCSAGVWEVCENARRLGLEIQYRKEFKPSGVT